MGAHRFRNFVIAAVMIAVSFGVALLIALSADAVAGRIVADPRLTAGLLFPPQVEVAYEMYEYSFTARTNEIGVRGEPYDLKKRPRVLVAAIGDSTTFGQGVDIEDTWVYRVEQALRAKGLDVQILNFGMPGSSPPYYANLAQESLHVIKPDLVFVDMLQSNDIIIAIDKQYPETTFRRDPWSRRTLRAWFPNLTDLAYRERAQETAKLGQGTQGRWNMIQHQYAQDFARMYAGFDGETREAFHRLPQPVQQALHDGRMRPQFALHCSAFARRNQKARRSMTLDEPEVQQQIDFAAQCLRRVARAIAPWNGKAAVLSIPSMMDTDPFASKVWTDLFGPDVMPRLNDTWADDPIHEAARRAGLPSHDVTEAYRAAARKEPLCFTLDTHMNERGNAVYAELIAPVIERYVREIGGYAAAEGSGSPGE